MSNKINFNGKEYNNLDEMPPDARRAYEEAMGQFSNMFADADRDGLPDIFENVQSKNVQVFSTSKIIFDGKEYNNADDMPLEARQKYEQAFEDKNRDGIPDAFENLGQGNVLVSSQQTTPNTPLPPTAVHTTVGYSPNILLIIAGVIIVFLFVVVAALVWILLF
jgi:hypothetical protein